MNLVDALRIPAKRNLAGLRTAIEEAQTAEGTVLRATFRSPRHGVVSVAGQGVRSGVMNGVGIGGFIVDPAGKPAPELAALGADAADEPADAVEIGSLQHGDVVTAHFTHPVHGDFAITGVALEWAAAPVLSVGGWLLRDETAAAPRVEAVFRHGTAEELGLDAPGRLAALDAPVV